MNELQSAILRTIAYYDVLDMAPTLWEAWDNLIIGERTQYTLGDVAQEIEQFCSDGVIAHKWGFYFLQGRDGLAEERIEKLAALDQKWKKVRWAIRLLAAVPYVRIVFGSGSFAIGNTAEDSDIDVLVVLEGGRIWTGRFLVTIVLHALGARRHGRVIKDRICLNHFITAKSLAIPFESLYNAHVYKNLVPLLLARDADPAVFWGSNTWLEKFFGNTSSGFPARSMRTMIPPALFAAIARFWEVILNTPFGDAVERALRNYQTRRILKNPATRSPRGHVVADDTMLAFHPESSEEAVLASYRVKLRELAVEEVA